MPISKQPFNDNRLLKHQIIPPRWADNYNLRKDRPRRSLPPIPMHTTVDEIRICDEDVEDNALQANVMQDDVANLASP